VSCRPGHTSELSLSPDSPATYPIAFTQSGLPTGTDWSVDLGGALQSSTNAAIGFTEPNGTYSYSVGHLRGYAATPASGNVTVDGASQNVSVEFELPYEVLFAESGLASGTNWTVDLGGRSQTSSAMDITFREGNGTYAFTAGNATGYRAYPATGNISVNGREAAMAIVFGGIVPSPIAPPPPPMPTPPAFQLPVAPPVPVQTSSRQPGPLGLTSGQEADVVGLVLLTLVGAAIVALEIHRRKAPPHAAGTPTEPASGAPPPSP